MKKIIKTLAFIFVSVFSTVSNADILGQFIESGTGVYPQYPQYYPQYTPLPPHPSEFQINFIYDFTLEQVISVSAGSFSDSAGIHTGITELSSLGNGNYSVLDPATTWFYPIAIEFAVSDVNGQLLASEIGILPGDYAFSVDDVYNATDNWAGYTQATITAAVPEPEAWTMLLLGLPVLRWFIARKSRLISC